ncbi:MAG TPA: NADH-quinone oxidoreductase subunit L [Candidatus Thiothrix moscowensis]|uniref:NADH-quinone oxidoreductase subunit L n=1 Tax=unclassified Thiothrix TaxID=2636184 RepID=UPI0025F85911|nr:MULTISPECIES: NADH-quinone oxidoreductase subunit L [unclassified Thiothrix]HRJ53362.1 NADH-quinone oxidoreductase subunit L [Candidatus Thiothrix moscowensis]HRJ94929.1 NADH-quinone oxidoreductase subunit L [Candidatus Thiothrix moscowensis]
MEAIYTAIPLASLFGAIVAGLFGKKIGRAGAHWVTILGVAVAFLLSVVVAYDVMSNGNTYNGTVYTWAVIGDIRFEVGFLLDNLSTMMMLVVTFVSLMVHIYTIGYMHEDPGYQRFFSYISLFTFSMLMLVMSNNFMQLFFGWEAVGLVSYLLIGFWFKKETAIFANMKAFLVNRVGDFGFLLGIAAIVTFYQTLDYQEVFDVLHIAKSPLVLLPGVETELLTFIAVCLFIGAMGKSAQVPLHVWLPDSMEGPTPISALIHAATMVTAGIFMVARMSPIFEMSDTALNLILVVGATTAFFMGLIGVVQNDIKRVVAYSTLSQLGYMTVALGASAYSAAVFHLMTHAFFKALLFLAAGSVIIAMHHEQDIRKMGGLKKYMPITYWTSLIGSLALIGFPGFSGFFSKDLIIEAVHHSDQAAAGYAYVLVLLGVFVTAFYSFRMFFLVFHGEERMDDHTMHHLHESPWVVTLPLIMLAIPSVLAGYFLDPMVVGDFFKGVIHVNDQAHGFVKEDNPLVSAHLSIQEISAGYHGVMGFILHGLMAPPFWLAMSGLAAAWYVYMKNDSIADWAYERFRWLHSLLDNKYYVDDFNQKVFAKGSLNLGNSLWSLGERLVIDGLIVNGSAKVVGWFAGVARHLQTGYLYHYAFSMVVGILLMITWFLFFN